MSDHRTICPFYDYFQKSAGGAQHTRPEGGHALTHDGGEAMADMQTWLTRCIAKAAPAVL